MNKVLKILIFCTFLFFGNFVFSQQIVSFNETYISDENLVYNTQTDKPFTGKAQRKRKNGHLVYEEEYKNGFIIESTVYYNRTKEPTPATKFLYDEKNNFRAIKKIQFGLKKNTKMITHFDINGRKKLFESYLDGNLIYSCEYKNNRKHGKEFCIVDGEDIVIEYINGKKVK